MPGAVDDCRAILAAGIARVDPQRMVEQHLRLDAAGVLHFATEHHRVAVPTTQFNRIVVVGAGKAGAAMARGIEQLLGPRITGGLLSVKYGHALPLQRIEVVEAGHPVPDAAGEDAARRILRLVAEADDRTLVIVLISGGGSALLPLGYHDGNHHLSLADLQQTTTALLAAGVPIQSVNCVRKHLSAVAGGRLAAAVGTAAEGAGARAGARVVTLILSDVVGDSPASIASGPTVADPTTFADAQRIIVDAGIGTQIPPAVHELVAAGVAGRVPETPKPGHPAFDAGEVVLLGTNAAALAAARTWAETHGYHTLVLTSRLTGEAREIAQVFAAIAREIAAGDSPVARPACILAGGETTVTLNRPPDAPRSGDAADSDAAAAANGLGGRNQEMAVAMLAAMAESPAEFAGTTFMSAGTDGTDGPTDAAGAIVALEHLSRTNAAAIRRALARHDAYPLLAQIGALLKTGPTNTNVCDLQALIVR